MNDNNAHVHSLTAIIDTLQKPLLTVTRTPTAVLESHISYYKDITFSRLKFQSNVISVVLFIHNNTTETLQLLNTNMTSVTPSECHIAPGELLTLTNSAQQNFYLSPASPQSVEYLNRNLMYGASNKKCRVETNFSIKSSFDVFSPTRTPTWNHKATSVGSQSLKCTSALLSCSIEEPYSYRVDVHIG